MAIDRQINFGRVTVSTTYGSSDVTIVLASGHGSRLPAAPFNVVWWNATDYPDPTSDPNAEIVRVTAISTDTLTVTRAQESTSGSTKNTAAKTYQMIVCPTAKFFNVDLQLSLLSNVNGRLTLTSATPVTTSDVTAALTLYHTPYNGCILALYYATLGAWGQYTLTEHSIKLTDSAQTGTMTSGNGVISGLTDTSQLVRGMKVTGTSVGAAAVISTIDSATQVTVSVNSSGSTTNTITFKCPASTLYDIFAVPTGTTTYRLQFGPAWTNNTTRATNITYANALNGVLVNDTSINIADSNGLAAQTARYLGTVATTTTDGQCEDSVTNRLVANYYNACDRLISLCPKYTDDGSATSYTTASTTWVAANSGTGSQGTYVSLGLTPVEWMLNGHAANNTGSTVCYAGVGDNSTTTVSVEAATGTPTSTIGANLAGGITLIPALGLRTVNLLIRVSAGTGTFYADDQRAGGSSDPKLTALSGSVKG